MDIPVELSKTIINENSEQQIVVLKEKGGSRSVPIVIGIVEIMAIDRRLRGTKSPRPMTHELVDNILHAIGAEISRVVISDLRNHTYYAEIYLSIDGKEIKVDSRPSDAIAITAGTSVPLYAAEQIFDKI